MWSWFKRRGEAQNWHAEFRCRLVEAYNNRTPRPVDLVLSAVIQNLIVLTPHHLKAVSIDGRTEGAFLEDTSNAFFLIDCVIWRIVERFPNLEGDNLSFINVNVPRVLKYAWVSNVYNSTAISLLYVHSFRLLSCP